MSAQGPLVLVLGLQGLGVRVWGQGLTTSKNDDVLTEHGGLLHVLSLGVHLIVFF